MLKLQHFFQELRTRPDYEDNKENTLTSLFPELTQEEDLEISRSLNIRDRSETKSRIISTLLSFAEIPVEIPEDISPTPEQPILRKKFPLSPRLNTPTAENPEFILPLSPKQPAEDFSTFRIKDQAGSLTFQVKRQSGDYSTFRIHDVNEDFSTFRIHKDSSEPVDTPPEEGSCPVFRHPEDWELKILALERGEWTPSMEEDQAFRRWKKDRPRVRSSLFLPKPFLQQLPQTPANNTSFLSTPHRIHTQSPTTPSTVPDALPAVPREPTPTASKVASLRQKYQTPGPPVAPVPAPAQNNLGSLSSQRWNGVRSAPVPNIRGQPTEFVASGGPSNISLNAAFDMTSVNSRIPPSNKSSPCPTPPRTVPLSDSLSTPVPPSSFSKSPNRPRPTPPQKLN